MPVAWVKLLTTKKKSAFVRWNIEFIYRRQSFSLSIHINHHAISCFFSTDDEQNKLKSSQKLCFLVGYFSKATNIKFERYFLMILWLIYFILVVFLLGQFWLVKAKKDRQYSENTSFRVWRVKNANCFHETKQGFIPPLSPEIPAMEHVKFNVWTGPY